MINSLPILVASENEDFRSFLRSLLEKNGLFHIFEAESQPEIEDFFRSKREKAFTLVHHTLLSSAVIEKLRGKSEFIVIAPKEDPSMTVWTAQLGVEHFLSFPFSSRRLMEKMSSVLH